MRSATRRNIVQVAAKHALCELQPPTTILIAPKLLADRMADTLKAFALRDRDLVRTTLAAVNPRFQPLDSGIQLRALIRLGDQFFWDIVDQPLADRLNGLINTLLSVGEYDTLPTDGAVLLALVRDQRARTLLPNLDQRFTTLAFRHRMKVAAVHRLVVRGSRGSPAVPLPGGAVEARRPRVARAPSRSDAEGTLDLGGTAPQAAAPPEAPTETTQKPPGSHRHGRSPASLQVSSQHCWQVRHNHSISPSAPRGWVAPHRHRIGEPSGTLRSRRSIACRCPASGNQVNG